MYLQMTLKVECQSAGQRTMRSWIMAGTDEAKCATEPGNEKKWCLRNTRLHEGRITRPNLVISRVPYGSMTVLWFFWGPIKVHGSFWSCFAPIMDCWCCCVCSHCSWESEAMSPSGEKGCVGTWECVSVCARTHVGQQWAMQFCSQVLLLGNLRFLHPKL